MTWQFSAQSVPLPAGEVQVKLEFDSDGLYANDQATFTDQYGIRSYVVFNYFIEPVQRGSITVIEVLLTDHTNSSVANFPGDYNLELNGSVVWNATDPVDLPRLGVQFTPPQDMFAGDYSWELKSKI